MIRLARILTVSLLCCLHAWATVRNVQSCGATGNGTADDTAAINTCIGLLVSGDTLEFPAGTYKVSSLTVNVPNVIIDGSSNTATIVFTTSGVGFQLGPCQSVACALSSTGVALSATANELSRSFTTTSSLGASVGSYVYLTQAGQDSSNGSNSTTCDVSGCRGEVVLITGVSGNTYTVATMLHDTYTPTSSGVLPKNQGGSVCSANTGIGNCATAYLLTSALSGATIQNITLNGNNVASILLYMAGAINSTVRGVTFQNATSVANNGSYTLHMDDAYGDALSNLTFTGNNATYQQMIGLFQHGNITVNNVSLSGTGGAFVEFADGANDTFTNLTVNAAGNGAHRAFKTTALRWSTFTNLIEENNPASGFNGVSIEYYSSHNLYTGCSVTGNAGGSGAAGINSFGNFNQFNTFYNCTVTGNGNVQLFNSGADALALAEDWYDSYYGNTLGGSGTQGMYQYGSNACVNGNVFNSGLSGGIAVVSPATGVVGSGNTLNGNSNNLTAGSCSTTGANGSGPLASLSASSVNFGSQAVNTTSGIRTVTLINGIGAYSGTSPLTFVTAPYLTTGTQFAISANTCTGAVSVGGSCTITLSFTPTSAGMQSDTLTLLDNAGGAGQTVALSGTGIATPVSYYVSSSSGSDANSGTSPTTPWATLGAHVNGGTFGAGAVIYLKRGDTWNEPLIPPSSGVPGNPISFDAYGTGAAPLLTPTINLSGATWTHNSGNIYTTTLSTTIASPQINNVQLGKTWGRKRSPNPGCTSAGVILGYGDFCVVYPTLYVYSPSGTSPATYYGSVVPVVGQPSGLAMVSIAGKSWITLQHIKVQMFDYMGVSVTGVSDSLVFANMEVDGMVPYGATPLGFYVNAANPAGIQFINDDAYFNYDGFRFDGTATAITVSNCRGYANRDTGLKDNTGHATYSYSHFYGNNVAQFPTSDAVGGIAGSGNVALVCGPTTVLPPGTCSSTQAPVVTNFATYPARFSFTVDDVGSQPNTEAYINTLAAVFAGHGTKADKFNAAVVPSYAVDWGSVNTWYAAGDEIDSHSWSHQYYSTNTSPGNQTPYPNAPAMVIQYVGAASTATLTISGSTLTTTVNGTTDLNISLSSYNALSLYQYLQGFVNYSVQQNTVLWATNNWPLSRPNTNATNLLAVSSQDIKSAPYTMLYDQTKLVPDEMTAAKNGIQSNVPGLTESFYVYPDGIEDPTTEAYAIAAGYTAARGSLAMKGQDNATGSANSLYSNGVNVQNITSLAAVTIHGLTQAQINQMVASLVFRAAAWGIPYGFFTHYDSRSDDPPTPDISNTELGYLLDAVTANGGVWLTNTGIANALTSGTGLSGGTRYVQNPTGGAPDLTVAGANSPGVGRGTATTYAVDLNGTNRSTLGTWDIGASTYLSQRYGVSMGSGSTYMGGWPITNVAQLPQNWVNSNEWMGTTTNTINFPSNGTGGSWSCGVTNYGPYTAGSQASLQQAVKDAEACRTGNGSGTQINIPAGTVYSGTTQGITLPQTAGDTSSNFIVLASSTPPTTGQTLCSHGIQDNILESTQPGIRNLGCNGSSLSYQLGTTITSIPSGQFTLANGTATNTSGYNDLAKLFTLTCTSVSCNAVNTATWDSNNLGPHHFAIIGAELAPQAGVTSPGAPVAIGQQTETLTSQIPTHIHLSYIYAHGDWTDAPVSGGVATGGPTGANSLPNGIALKACINCSVNYSYLDRILRPGGEGHGIYMGLAQQIKIDHNWVEGASIGAFAGGYSSNLTLPNFINAQDVEDRGNRYTYPYSWILANAAGFCVNGLTCSGNGYVRKNSHETKVAQRYLYDGNINENVDNSGGQSGIAISWKTDNVSTGTGTNYWILNQNVTMTNTVMRNLCHGASWGFRAANAAGNGGGVTLPTQNGLLQNNLSYNVSVTNPGCTGSSNFGFRVNNTGGNTWVASATRDSAGATSTLTLTSAAGATQSDMNAGDPVSVTGCTDSTFNTSATGLTVAISGTSPTTLTVVYPNAGTANATTTGCTLSNLPGWPRFLAYIHNSDFVNDGTNPTSPYATANSSPLPLSRNMTFIDSIFVGGGVSSTFGEGTRTQTKAFDATTEVFNNDLFPGRDGQVTCPGHSNPAAGGMAACYTEYSGSSVASTPATLYGVPASYCTGNDPTTGNCVGIVGAMSQNSFPAVLPDWHQYRLCHSGDAVCNSKASLYSAGQSYQAPDGADLGVNMSAIDAAETATKYVCPSACGSGPSAD